MEIIYQIDSHNFKDYGVRVSSSTGLLAGLKPKLQNKIEWPDEDGFCVDDSQLSFEARDIALNCFVSAASAKVFLEKINAFSDLFYIPGLKTLKISLGENVLSYQVLLADKIEIAKKFKEDTNIGTFSLKLIEPNPVR